MKHKLYLSIGLILLFITLAAWANAALQVKVSGLASGAMLTNVNNAVNNQRGLLQIPLTQTEVIRFYNKVPEAIKKAMQPFGYYRPEVLSNLRKANGTWLATFNITPGPAIRITKLDFKITGGGQHDRAFQKIIKNLPLKVGDVLKTEKYNKVKQTLFNHATNRGYFKARMIESKIIINLKTYQATVIIHFYTGPRYRFGETYFSKTPFTQSFLNRFLTYKRGRYFNYRKLQNTQQGLASSNYFAQTVITPLPNQAINNEVPIKIRLKPLSKAQYLFGVGFGTDTGARGTLGLTLRRVNSHGHRFRALLRGSSRADSSFTAGYEIPGPNPTKDLFTISGGIGHIDQKTGQSNVAKVSVSYATQFGLLHQIIALTYLKERYNIRDLLKTSADLLYPSIHWQYINTRSRLHPRNGFSLHLDLAGTTKSLTRSKSGFFQTHAQAKFIVTILHNTRVLLRASGARTDINNINNLPLSLQLFAGGALSVRGFGYNAIGPGRNLFVGSVEIQQRIYKNWYLAAFYDAGNVTDDSPFKDLNEGVGPAIVWLAPFGQVELSFANAISVQGKPWRIQFSIGPAI